MNGVHGEIEFFRFRSSLLSSLSLPYPYGQRAATRRQGEKRLASIHTAPKWRP